MKIQGELLPIIHNASLHPIIQIMPDERYRESVYLGYDELKERKLEVDVKTYSPKRSRQANNYSWALTDKLSDFMVIRGLKLSKIEMHAEMIFRYGQPYLDDNGDPVIYSTASSIKMPDFYDYAREIGESELDGKIFKHYKVYRGSHTYTSKEMSVFIAGIVEECQEYGIQTETPDQIARMISLMEKHNAS